VYSHAEFDYAIDHVSTLQCTVMLSLIMP
jgi:hypothetical protein